MRLNDLPLTRVKLAVARTLYALTRPLRRSEVCVIERQGIRYRVDLSEGIDFSIYLFGSYQKHVLASEHVALRPGAVVVDVGANIGQMTLLFAKMPAAERVYAFEPTDYAFAKLEANLALNPELRLKIVAVKAFVADGPSPVAALEAYSSWPIGGRARTRQALHPVHGGAAMAATRTPCVTLDAFAEERQLSRIDLIKIDTDGHELAVLRGARQVIEKHRPAIVFEWGQYLLRERGIDPAHFFDLFDRCGGRLVNLANRHEVTRENYAREIPARSTTDVLVRFN